MEAFVLISLLLAVALSLRLVLLLLKATSNKPRLPPGPSFFFFLKTLVFQKKSIFELEETIGELHKTYGPIVTLPTFTDPVFFVQDHAISHQALVQNSTAFADRPPPKEPFRYLTCNRHDICSSNYGPLWRLYRRNLASEVFSPAKLKLFAPARRRALRMLLSRLAAEAATDASGRAYIIYNYQFVLFSLILYMCFGERIEDEERIKELRAIQFFLITLFTRFNFFAVLPGVAKLVFRRKWDKIVGARRRQAEVFAPLIRARREARLRAAAVEPFPYVDSLVDLDIPEEGGTSRRLTEDEIVNLCHEFVSGSTDTTSTTLEWIMAQLVKHPEMQRRLAEEIGAVVPPEEEEVKDEDLGKMPYLKAVITEALRRHPAGHFLLPHAVSKDVELAGFLIPKGAEVLFNVMQLAVDERVWKDPMEFRPERFLGCGDDEDVSGKSEVAEVKMMPFGAGRRVCPGVALSMLHLGYFVANLVREFEWESLEGEEVDLTERFVFTIMMKNPLHARIIPRRTK